MDEWVLRAMKRWPNVPALFGWLRLDRRGRWLIRDEVITHHLIVQTIHRNYARDDHGRWFFQNGPQRGYIQLAYAPFVLRTSDDQLHVLTHNNLLVTTVNGAFLDEEGTLLLDTEHGPGEVLSSDLEWALSQLLRAGQPVTEEHLGDALSQPSGATTPLTFEFGGSRIPLRRLDRNVMPVRFHFERDPQPRLGERSSSGAPD